MPDRIGATELKTGKTTHRRASRGAAIKDLASMGAQAIPPAPPKEKTMNQHVDQKNFRIEPVVKPTASQPMQSAATSAALHDRSGTSEAKLLQLRNRHHELLEQRVPLKEERERLWGVAATEWKALGLSIDDNIDQWNAHMERTGYVQAEDADNEILDAIMKVEEAIRSIPATSFAGLSAKLAVVRNNLGSEFDDDLPRGDQDWHVFLFNEFANEVDRLGGGVSSTQPQRPTDPQTASSDPLLNAINAFRAGVTDFDAYSSQNDDERDAYARVSYFPPMEVLQEWDRPAVTRQGALEAIRFALQENREIGGNVIVTNMLAAAFAHFERDGSYSEPTEAHDKELLRLDGDLRRACMAEAECFYGVRSAYRAEGKNTPSFLAEYDAWGDAAERTSGVVDAIEAAGGECAIGRALLATARIWRVSLSQMGYLDGDFRDDAELALFDTVNLLRKAAGLAPYDWDFLSGEAPQTTTPRDPMASSVAAEPADPMLEAIKAYRAGYAAFMTIPESQITKDNEDDLVAATYGPPQDAILRNAPHTPKVASIAGVREAIRLTFEENALIDCLAENALREALAYLDAQA